MGLQVKEILQQLEQLAPISLAEDWDNVGLLVGDPGAEVTGILISLDVDGAVMEEALEKNCNLILSHHPIIYKPFHQLHYDQPLGKLLAKAIQHNLNLIAMHTNYDHASLGVSYQLARKLGLEEIQVLAPKTEKLFKLVIYVPKDYEESLRKALGDAGAGHIGNYSHCTFRSEGTGTFLPGADTNPFVGIRGKLEEVRECRIETIVPQTILSRVLQAMLIAHPYEEVAYDLIPLANQTYSTGLGRVGILPQPKNLTDFALEVKAKLGLQALKLAGRSSQVITRVAVCGGAGKTLISQALDVGVDVMVTGELGHHEAQLGLRHGMALIDAGHFATEQVALPYLASFLADKLTTISNIPVILSTIENDLWDVI
jgi:dinuclear metal center YbgI/SA1388 family protein